MFSEWYSNENVIVGCWKMLSGNICLQTLMKNMIWDDPDSVFIFATNVLLVFIVIRKANNIDTVAVASRLGHEDATVTLQTYAHALRRRDEDAARVTQHLFDQAAYNLHILND